MILWLASYPRSGNTLCRLVMHECFGLGSYSDQGNGFERPVIGLGDANGILEFGGDWNDFYKQSLSSKTLYAIKSHQHPQDDQPGIVIVRDPRSSLYSYFRYLKSHYKHATFELCDIVRGNVLYGGWLDFYRAWGNRMLGSNLVIYFDELVELKPRTLQRIASFTGLKPTGNKKIDFQKLKESKPDFFRDGKMNWSGAAEWTPEIEELFQTHYADVMNEHGWE